MKSVRNMLARVGYLPWVGGAGFVIALILVFARPTSARREPVVEPPQSKFERSVAGIGVIEPRSEMIAIGSELSGVVRAVHVKVGDRVTAGSPLFSLDQRDVDAQIAYLKARLDSAKVEVQNADALFRTASELIVGKAVSRDEFNTKKFAFELAKARQQEIERQLEESIVTKNRLTVNAPIDGQLLEVNVRPGEFAPAGVLSAPLMRMGDTSTLHVRVEIDEENFGRVRATSPAIGILRSDTGREIPLTFLRFEPYIKPKQNLAATNQRVDTRVAQILYEVPAGVRDGFVGQFMDVFVGESSPSVSAQPG